MSASTPMVARATSQRRTNQSTASQISNATAANPSVHRPAASFSRTGPSMTALVISGTEMVAARLTKAATTIAIQRTL